MCEQKSKRINPLTETTGIEYEQTVSMKNLIPHADCIYLFDQQNFGNANMHTASKVVTSRRMAGRPGFYTKHHSKNAGCVHICAVGQSAQNKIIL